MRKKRNARAQKKEENSGVGVLFNYKVNFIYVSVFCILKVKVSNMNAGKGQLINKAVQYPMCMRTEHDRRIQQNWLNSQHPDITNLLTKRERERKLHTNTTKTKNKTESHA